MPWYFVTAARQTITQVTAVAQRGCVYIGKLFLCRAAGAQTQAVSCQSLYPLSVQGELLVTDVEVEVARG